MDQKKNTKPRTYSSYNPIMCLHGAIVPTLIQVYVYRSVFGEKASSVMLPRGTGASRDCVTKSRGTRTPAQTACHRRRGDTFSRLERHRKCIPKKTGTTADFNFSRFRLRLRSDESSSDLEPPRRRPMRYACA